MRIFGFILALVLAGSIAAAARAHDGGGSPTPRQGALHVTKDCTGYQGQVDGHCTITSSNLKGITVGSRVVYAQAAGATSLDSDVVLDVVGPGNNTAFGHCALNFKTKLGLCTFWGGTGQFTWFHARVVVSADSAIPSGWHWEGTYSFGHRDGDQNGDNQ